ncbi:MAG: FtsH protease activity modulator HflK [Cocleimonas sp.]|nr:FtsH protease activity modulator HflK [Cocleimonas sp.]
MPWNEPGGSDKNPWGNKDKSSGNSKGKGTADIEDITRKMNEKLGGLFGNKKSGNNKGSDGPSGSVLALIGIALLGAWLATGFYTVDSAQRGVEFRFGAYTETTRPGLHWHVPYPVESVELVDIDRSRTAEDRTHMLTKDENIVDIGVTAQYRIKNPEDYLFNVYLADYERNQSIGTLHQVMRSAVREIAGRNTMDSILKENRGTIAPDTQQVMQKVLDSYKTGLEVIKVNVTYAEAPQEVKDAFDDANRAREDKDRYKNQAETYAKKVVPIAEGKASRLSEAALAYTGRIVSQAEGDASRFNQLVAEYRKAPAVTRKRLYLETMEEVYENTSKIMVDTKSGNNVMYLPLDKLSGGSNSSSTSSQSFDPAIATSVEQLRRQNQSTRSGGRDATRQGR